MMTGFIYELLRENGYPILVNARDLTIFGKVSTDDWSIA